MIMKTEIRPFHLAIPVNNLDVAKKLGDEGKKWILHNRNYKDLAISLEKSYLNILRN